MAHHDFLIRYSNGFKRHVSKQERDILSASLKQIGPREYLSSASLNQELELKERRRLEESGPGWLDMRPYIFVYRSKREFEREQTPIGMLRQLEQMGLQVRA